jgi:hypothetical protein
MELSPARRVHCPSGGDHLRYTEACAQAGVGRVPQRQAADTAQALAESLGEVSDLATKADIAVLKSDINELRAELKADMAELRAEIRGELNTHLRWIIGTMLGVAALAVAASKLLP